MKTNLSEWALKHPQMVMFLLALLSIGGLLAYGRLGQKEDPEFTVKAMLVQAAWPGASAQAMAEQVTDKLEKKLQEVAEIDSLTSYAKPGLTQITVTLRESTPAAAVPQVWYQVRKKLGDIQHTLPAGVKGPLFNDEFGDTFGNLYAITGDGFSIVELKHFADAARNELLRVADVNKVELHGVQAEKVYVEASNAKLASLGLDPGLIASTLAATNTVEPAGTVQTASEQLRLSVSGEFDSVEAIRNIGIRAGERQFRLGDIAEVRRGVVDPATSAMRFNGQPAIGLALSMRQGGDVIRLGRALEATVHRVQASLPVGVQIHAVSDQPRVVEESVHEFKKSLFEAVAIVLVVSFFSLGLRTGLVVALSIPLVLALTFLAMYFLDIELQRISLGALIIALGLLVDDAIIAVEMMALKLEQGWDRFRAATYAYTATAFPMLTGTLITAAGFLPVGFAKSGSGEYVFSLFQVVGLSLMLSWIVAVVFTPFIGHRLLKEQPQAHHDEDAVYQRGFYARFRTLVNACLRRRRWVIGGTLLAFVGALALFKLVPQQFFPASDRPELMVDLWLPQAASYEASAREVAALEAKLRQDPDVVAVTSYVGTGSPRFYLPLDVQTPNLNLGELMVMTKGGAARERVLAHIQQLFDTEFPLVRGRVNRLENGPPVGYPVQFRVYGNDNARVQAIADELQALMRAHPNLRRVNQDWGERLKRVRVDIDQDKARALGISSHQVKQALQGSLSGSTVTTYRERDEDLDVVARLVEAERSDLNNLKDAKIYLRNGQFVPVSQVARLSLDSEDSVLWRRNRVPTITVRADVAGAEGPDVTAALKPQIDALVQRLPLGYGIEVGGAQESSRKAQASIAAVMPMTIVIVLLLLMLQLQDIQKMALVLLTAPLGLIGVSVMLAAFRIPFGFVAMLGVIALAGMIIRNAVILVVQIDHDLAAGRTLWDAIVESTVRRLRPIVLTALAAILAMIPLTRSVFWGPMAWAIMGGLAVATLLTLLFLPALYASWYGARQPGQAPAPQRRRPAWRRWAGVGALLGLFSAGSPAVDLSQAYRQAMQADPTLRAAQAALQAGREKAVQGDALLKPQVALSAGLTRVDEHSDAGLPAPLNELLRASSSGTVQQAALQLKQPLYDLKSAAERQQLKQQSGIAEIRFRHAQQQLMQRVGEAYFGVLLAQESLQVTRAEKAAVQAQRDRAQARFEVGRGKATDLQEAQARLDGVAAKEVSAQRQLALAQARYEELTGQPAEGLAPLQPRLQPTPPAPDSLAEWQARGQAGNTQVLLKQGERAIATQELRKHALQARPTLDLVASYTVKGASGSLSPVVAPDGSRSAAIGLQFNVPLYAGGALDSRQREAVAKGAQADEDLKAALRDARLQVQDAFLAVKTGVARIAALDQSLLSARTALEATTLGRDLGTRTELDVLDAQQRLFNAQLDLAQARHDYLLGRLQLGLAAGDLQEADLQALNAWLAV